MRLTRKRRKPQAIQLARHEAAHAVAAEVVGHSVQVARLTRKGCGYVRVHHGSCRDPMRHGIVALAGHAADMKWGRFGMWRNVSAVDKHIFDQLGFRDMSAVTILNIARSLVDAHADIIQALAVELKQRDLSGDECREIMQKAGFKS